MKYKPDHRPLAEKALRLALVEEIGYDQRTASALVKHRCFPSRDRAVEIEQKIGITVGAWKAKTATDDMWQIVLDASK